MNTRYTIMALMGLLGLIICYVLINALDLMIIYSIFLYFQFLMAPLFTAFGYLTYVVRMCIPYVFIYFLVCLFLNLQYRKNFTIRIFKYSIDITAVQNITFFVYLRQYSYVLIISINLLLLLTVYYAVLYNKYFYLLFLFLFYLFVWIIIKIKQLLFKKENLRFKKVHMLVNLMLVILIGTYISMALEEFNLYNFKLSGFGNFWKLLENKFLIKMPVKDFKWNRLLNWSKQLANDRYMFNLKKSFMRSSLNDNKQIGTSVKVPALYFKLSEFNNSKNSELNVNDNLKIYELKPQNEDYRNNLGRFTTAFYKKFKKVFRIQMNIKTTNFVPTSELNSRQKLIGWLRNLSNYIDTSKDYVDINDKMTVAYNSYLDLLDKKLHTIVSKKVFLITFNKKYMNLKIFFFLGDFQESFKKKYAIFLNTKKKEVDFVSTNSLNFEYRYDEFDTFWKIFKSEIYILFKEHKIVSFFKGFKKLYTIKVFKVSLKKDIFADSDLQPSENVKPKSKKLFITEFKKLKYWKSFKLNFKETIYKYTTEHRRNIHYKLKNFKDTLKVISNKTYLDKKLLYPKYEAVSNEVYFLFDGDIAYRVLEDLQLEQVEDLEIDEEVLDEDSTLNKYLRFQLDYYNKRALFLSFAAKNTVKRVYALDKYIIEMQRTEIHRPRFSNMYHEILLLNASDFFKNILKNWSFIRHTLTMTRSFLPFNTWQTLMNKLLNLNFASFYLKNFKHLTEAFSNNVDGLVSNYSLVYKILQNKYDLAKFQMIPELEGIPGTSYEYTVKYKQQIERCYWYEEQEIIMDWIFEMSFRPLVDLMDGIHDVPEKEDSFLRAMLSLYLQDQRYIWIPIAHDLKLSNAVVYSDNLQKINNFDCFVNQLSRQHWALFEHIKNDEPTPNFYQRLEESSFLDFDSITNIQELNLKVGRDVLYLRLISEWEKYRSVLSWPEWCDDFWDSEHLDYHKDKFISAIKKIRPLQLDMMLLDLSAPSGVGYTLEHASGPFPMKKLDIFFEKKFIEKLLYFEDEYESNLEFDYKVFLDIHELLNILKEEHAELDIYYRNYMLDYQYAAKKAHYRILQDMVYNLEEKHELLDFLDESLIDLMEASDSIQALKDLEYEAIGLENLPMVDLETKTLIEENFDILSETTIEIFMKAFNNTNKTLDETNNILIGLKKNTKLYGAQLIEDAKRKNPVTMRFSNNNWDNYSYHSNKKDKFMHTWYKKK